MLTFTDRAREVVRSYLDKSAGEPQALRITLHDGSPLAPRYDLALVAPGDRHDDEVTLDTDDFTVLVREGSVDRLDGATVDFIERDGEGTEVYIEMGGGCQGCALSRMTLRQGVERMLRDAVPEITELHDVTDHAVGANPYFPQKA
jgi:Fe-S cluster biogenesis protein NfuA